MQDLLVNWFGATGATVVRYAFALIVVIALLLALRWVLRTYVVGGQLSVGRARQNRLSIVDQVVIDQRRRLLLVRRDGVEHLILIGGGNDLVVEPTIIRGVPVGSLGRTARPAPTAATEEPDGVDEPVRDASPAVAARPVAPAAAAPVPARPSFPSHAAEHPKATSIQARINRTPRKGPEPARQDSASPYIPPEAHRVEPSVAPIAPIIPDRAPAIEPVAERHAPEPLRAPVEPAAVADDEPSFDDLARQLDEALQSEIDDIKGESLPPIPAPVEPPKVEPARPVVPAASAWLRPRNAQQPRPFVPREPTVSTPSPRAQAAPAAVEPPAPPIEAPEPVAVPRAAESAPPAAPAVQAPSQDDRPASDFSSLESEMARLLDELAGDSKGKR